MDLGQDHGGHYSWKLSYNRKPLSVASAVIVTEQKNIKGQTRKLLVYRAHFNCGVMEDHNNSHIYIIYRCLV
jgi:hypothetical protein